MPKRAHGFATGVGGTKSCDMSLAPKGRIVALRPELALDRACNDSGLARGRHSNCVFCTTGETSFGGEHRRACNSE